jgi:hypothetical protein
MKVSTSRAIVRRVALENFRLMTEQSHPPTAEFIHILSRHYRWSSTDWGDLSTEARRHLMVIASLLTSNLGVRAAVSEYRMHYDCQFWGNAVEASLIETIGGPLWQWHPVRIYCATTENGIRNGLTKVRITESDHGLEVWGPNAKGDVGWLPVTDPDSLSMV